MSMVTASSLTRPLEAFLMYIPLPLLLSIGLQTKIQPCCKQLSPSGAFYWTIPTSLRHRSMASASLCRDIYQSSHLMPRVGGWKGLTCCCLREEEPKYIVRTLISNLRVGANWRSVIPGLARAFVAHEKGAKASKAEMDAASAKVSEAFHLCPNLGVLIPALMEGGLEELERRCTLKAGELSNFHWKFE